MFKFLPGGVCGDRSTCISLSEVEELVSLDLLDEQCFWAFCLNSQGFEPLRSELLAAGTDFVELSIQSDVLKVGNLSTLLSLE